MGAKIPWHVRQYAKAELMNYSTNKKKVEYLKGNEKRNVSRKIKEIEKAFDRLSEYDREIASVIFIEHYTQIKAEIEKGITYKIYYRVMNKLIQYTAEEMKLI